MLVPLATSVLIALGTQGGYRSSYPLPGPFFGQGWGVNIHTTALRAGEGRMIREGGFRWIRMDLFWHQVERSKGVYDFSGYDRLVADLAAEGIRPLFILCYGNDLYEPGAPKKPESQDAFARFAAAAVDRYRGKGAIWEMWNEPNIHFWPPRPNVDEYIGLATRVGKAIRRIAPEEWHVGPATSGFDWDFLQRCFEAGLLEYWDAVTVHPYRNTEPETVAPDWAKLRRLIDRYSGKGQPMLSGEWGYSEKYPGMNAERQAHVIGRQVLTNLASGVNLSIWYDWMNDGEDPGEVEHWFGTVDHRMGPKPAYLAAKELGDALSGYRFRMRIPQPNSAHHVLLFQHGQKAKFAAWTTGKEGSVFTPDGVRTILGPQARVHEAVESPAVRWLLRWRPLPSDLTAAQVSAELDAQRAAWKSLNLPQGATLRVIDLGAGGEVPEDLIPAPKTRSRLPSELSLDPEPRTLRLELRIPGVPVLIQEAKVWPAKPVSFHAALSLDGKPMIIVRNGSGASLAAVANIQNGTSNYDRKVTLKPNLAELQIPLEGVGARELSARLVNKAGETLVQLPRTRLVPLPAPEGSLEAATDGDPKIEGQASVAWTPAGDLLFEAFFQPGWKYATLAARGEFGKPLKGRPSALGLWVYGDRSGYILRMRYVDSAGQTFQPDWGPIDWEGWRLVTFRLDGGNVGRWGGPADGVVRHPIRLEAPLLIDSQGGRGGEARIRAKGFYLSYGG